MQISLNMVPVPQWTHREFQAPDPWAQDLPTRWQLVVCRLVSETFAATAAARAPRQPPSEGRKLPRSVSLLLPSY